MPVGGDLIEVTYNHPTLGSGVIFFKAAEDGTLNLGGVRTSDDMNAIDGGGRPIYTLNRQRWGVEGTLAWDMQVNFDLQKLTALASDPQDSALTFSHINNSIFTGTGRPVGDVAGSTNASTIGIKFSGGSVLKQL